jgi:hypothetical protein
VSLFKACPQGCGRVVAVACVGPCWRCQTILVRMSKIDPPMLLDVQGQIDRIDSMPLGDKVPKP